MCAPAQFNVWGTCPQVFPTMPVGMWSLIVISALAGLERRPRNGLACRNGEVTY
jgi:hypothetical protein